MILIRYNVVDCIIVSQAFATAGLLRMLYLKSVVDVGRSTCIVLLDIGTHASIHFTQQELKTFGVNEMRKV